MGLCSMKDALPFVAMMTVILAQVSNMEIIKAAMSNGINKYIILVYSNAISTLIFLLSSLIIHRSRRPPLSFSILCGLFLLAVFGCCCQIFSYVGLQYSSPTLSTAMLNLVPAFTFILAVIFRMETLKWRSRSTQAKSLRTLVSIAGAFVVTFYKGPSIIKAVLHTVSVHQLLSPPSNWILGGFFLAAEAFLSSAVYILQASITEKFPALNIIVFFVFFFSTILAAVFSLIVVTDLSAWKLRLDMGLVTVLYSGFIGTGVRGILVTWCLSRTGPIYVSMFKPLAIIFSVIIGVIFAGEALHLGSVIGAVIIVAGFYGVMWAKFKGEQIKSIEDYLAESHRSSRETLTVPLLQNRIEETNSRSSV